jgi:CubicO group peptidase (beta-lactamase class C family)
MPDPERDNPLTDSPVAVLGSFVSSGTCPGGQLTTWVGGEQVLNHAVGQARPGVPMTVDTKVRLDCAGKPILALGVLWLSKRGLLAIDEPVSTYIPEFACGGKDGITLRHLLTHTAGGFVPDDLAPYRTPPAILERALFAGSIQDWVPGSMAEYDPWGGWFTLAAIIERVTASSWADFLSQHILEPLGMADLELIPGAEKDRSRLELPYHSLSNKRPFPIHRLDRPDLLAYPNPAFGAYASMQVLGSLYLILASRPRCEDLLGVDPDFLRTPQRPVLYDAAMERCCSMGFGMFLGLNQWSYSKQISHRSFGHHSNAGTWAFCDPDADLVVSLRMNGAPIQTAPLRSLRRGGHPVIAAIYRELSANSG